MSILEEKQFSSLLKEKIALFYQSMKLVCAILMVTFPDRCHLYIICLSRGIMKNCLFRDQNVTKCPSLQNVQCCV